MRPRARALAANRTEDSVPPARGREGDHKSARRSLAEKNVIRTFSQTTHFLRRGGRGEGPLDLRHERAIVVQATHAEMNGFRLWACLEGSPLRDVRKLLIFHALMDWINLMVWLVSFIFVTTAVRREMCSPLLTESACRSFVAQYLTAPLLSFFVPLVVISAAYYMFVMMVNSLYAQSADGDAASPQELRRHHRFVSYVCVFFWVHLWAVLLWAITIAMHAMYGLLPLLLNALLQDAYALHRVTEVRGLLALKESKGAVPYLEARRRLKEVRPSALWFMFLCPPAKAPVRRM